MLKLHSLILIFEAHSHLHIDLNTIPAQEGKLLLTRGSRAASKAHVGAERGEMLPASFSPGGGVVLKRSHCLTEFQAKGLPCFKSVYMADGTNSVELVH